MWTFKLPLSEIEQCLYSFLFPHPEYAQVIKMLGSGRLEAMCLMVLRDCATSEETEKKGSCGDLFYFIIKLWLKGEKWR